MGMIYNPLRAFPLTTSKTSGGVQQFGIPGTAFTAVGTAALAAKELRYVPFRVETAITLSAFQFEITTGPTEAAKFRVGVYRASGDLQPTGAVLLEKEIEVAKEATGVKKTEGLSIKLEPGVYLVVTNGNVAITMRVLTTPTPIVAAGMGTNSLGKALITAGTEYGAFAGTKWATVVEATAGLAHAVVLQWS